MAVATTAAQAAAPLTRNDIDIGVRLFAALLAHRQRAGATPLDYAALLEAGRLADPKDAAMGRAEVLGVASKLRFISDFCAAQGYPDLACLAVHPLAPLPGAGTGTGSGAGMPAADAWQAALAAVASFDWTGAGAPLPAFAEAARARVPARWKARKERPAEVAWYAYFCAHRDACKTITSSDKKEVVNLVMAGLDPETALQRLLAAKAAFTEAGAPLPAPQ
jgi:hypothetical protein